MTNLKKLLRGLRSQNAKRRRNAISGLYKLGVKHPNAIFPHIRTILDAVDDREQAVAIQASELLLQLSKSAPGQFLPLIGAIVHRLEGLIEQGAEYEGSYQPYIDLVSLLGNLGSVAPDAVAPVLPFFQRCLNYPVYRPDHPEKGMRQFYAAIIRAVGLIGRVKPVAILNLIPTTVKCFADTFKYSILRNESQQRDAMRPWAIFAITEILKSAPEYVAPAVLRFVNADNEELKLQMRQIMAMMGEKLDRILPSLLTSMTAKDKSIRSNAVDVLEKFGRSTPAKVVPVLSKCLLDENERMQKSAMETLGAIGQNNPDYVLDAIPRIVDKIGSASREIRVAAVEAVTQIGSSDIYPIKDAIPHLVRHLDDQDSNVRWVAIGALEKIALHDTSYIEEAIPLLTRCLKDSHDHVRWRAADALKKMKVDPIEHPRILRTLDRLERQIKASPLEQSISRSMMERIENGRAALASRDYTDAMETTREVITRLDELRKSDAAYASPHTSQAYSLDRPRYGQPSEASTPGVDDEADIPPRRAPERSMGTMTAESMAAGAAGGGGEPVRADPLATMDGVDRSSFPPWEPPLGTDTNGPRSAPDTAGGSAEAPANEESMGVGAPDNRNGGGTNGTVNSLADIARRAIESLAQTRGDVEVPMRPTDAEGAKPHHPRRDLNWHPTEHMPDTIHPDEGAPGRAAAQPRATDWGEGASQPEGEVFSDWEFPPWQTEEPGGRSAAEESLSTDAAATRDARDLGAERTHQLASETETGEEQTGDGGVDEAEREGPEVAGTDEASTTEAVKDRARTNGERMARFCRYCGSSIPIGGRFCNKCGRRLN